MNQSSSLKESGDTALRQWHASTGRLLKQSERLPLGPEKLVILDDALSAVDAKTEESILRHLQDELKRRALGICGNAPCQKTPELNPRTGKRFWACQACRLAKTLIDRKVRLEANPPA